MDKIGRENWALKFDVTMLKKKRDDLENTNEKLTSQVEALSMENRELKRDLKRTKEELEKRESELDEACRIYERLGQTGAVLAELSKSQAQNHQQSSLDEYTIGSGRDYSPRSPIMKVDRSSPSSRMAFTKFPHCAQAPEFDGPTVCASGRFSPTPSLQSTASTKTGVSRSGFQSPLPNKSNGLPYLASPSVSTCCSLRRIPRHVPSDDEEDECSSSEDEITTSNTSRLEKKYDSEFYGNADREEPRKLRYIPEPTTLKRHITKLTPPSSVASICIKRESCRRVLRYNRENEPDTSDYSSGEDVFDSDVSVSTTSVPQTPTSMPASPPTTKANLSTNGQAMEWRPRAVALAAKRISYTGFVDLAPIHERPVMAINTNRLSHRYPMFDGLNLQERKDSAASSMVNASVVSRCQVRNLKSRIPAPSTTSVVAKKRKHLDTLSRKVLAKEVMGKHMIKV